MSLLLKITIEELKRRIKAMKDGRFSAPGEVAESGASEVWGRIFG